jgi:Undecaprenyl-phosphate galactose phosphotransferase WbaP
LKDHNSSTTDAVDPVKSEVQHATRPRNSTWKQQGATAILVASDVFLAGLIWLIAFNLQGIWGRGELSIVSVTALVPIMVMWIGLRVLLGLYPGYGLDAVEELRRHTYATLCTLAILAVFALSLQVGDLLSRLLLALVFMGLLLSAPFVRVLVKGVLNGARLWGKPVVIVGYQEPKTELANLLEVNWQLGHNPVAVFDYPVFDHRRASHNEGFEVLSDQQPLASVSSLSHEHGVDTLIFAMPYTSREQLARLVSLAAIHFRHVLITPDLTGITNSAVMARNLAGTFAVEAKYNLLDPWALRVKRIGDLCITLVGGVLALPLFLVLTLLVYLQSGGSIFYRDRRMGQGGKVFSCIKFRTMVAEAEDLLERMLKEDEVSREEYARYHKLRDDPRITSIGRLLRKTSLDELPQIWNVIKGEMSLVGPRPYLPRESKEIGMAQSEILRVRPGITGPWQVAGRNETTFHSRVEMDAHYVHNWSVWLDVVLLARTLKIVLVSRGAY